MTVCMKKKVSFEEAMGRLEEIVAQLEGGSVPLDSSLKLYEEGTALIRLCSETLEHAQLKMKNILEQEPPKGAPADSSDEKGEGVREL